MYAKASVLLLILVLAAGGCISRKPPATPPDPTAKGFTPGAASDYYFLLYQELSRQGQPKQAVPVLEKLIELSPTPELYRDLANIHWSLGDKDKTQDVLRQGLEKFPNDKTLFFYLANSYLLQRNFDAAVKTLKDYRLANPTDQAVSQELGAVLVEAGRHQEALDLLSRLPRDKRTPAMAYYESKAYSGLGKRKQAIDKLRQALREDPNMLTALSELAFIHEQAGEYRQAEDAYRRIVDQGEEGPDVLLRLIRLALKQKNEAKALQLVEKGSKDRNFLVEAMSLFVEEGYQDGANKVLDALGLEDPDNSEVALLQAMLALEKEKNPGKAFEILGRIPKNNKNYDKSLITRIQLALDMNQPADAAALLEEGKKLFADRVEFYFLEAILYDKQGNLPQAQRVLHDGLAKWPGDTEILYRYGTVLERLKKHDEAMQAMEKILAKDPNHADALNFVGYALAEKGQDLDRAIELISKALVAKPDSPYYLDSLAWTQLQRKQPDKAWETIRRAVMQPVEDPTIWEHYGDIAKAVGNKQEAAKGYRKALEMSPPNAGDITGKLESL